MPLQQYDTIKLRDEFEGTLGDHDAIDRHTNRTPGKDEVAEHIKTEVIAKGRWPIQMTQLAEETGYSRQHAANVVSDYFVGVDDDEINSGDDPTQHASPMSASPGEPSGTSATSQTDGQTSGSSGQTGTTETKTVFVKTNDHVEEVEMQIPADVDRSSYIRGFLDRAQQE